MPKIPAILDNEDFEIKQEKKKKDDEIHEEIDLARLKDETYAEISKAIEFYFGRENYKFLLVCSRLGLNKDNEIFIDFLSSDIGSQIFRENMLSIHIETRNIFYSKYNPNESIYSFFIKSTE